MNEDLSAGVRREIAIVTPSWNRRALLSRLFESLCAQTDKEFTWVVVDDCSTDDTQKWLDESTTQAEFDVLVLRNEKNRGKCASLNRAFDEVEANFYLVVDSDDALATEAVRLVRAKVNEYEGLNKIGAIFFSYMNTDGISLGEPPSPGDVAMTRAAYDAAFRKYDGAVGYFRRVVARYKYPEYANETYMGPTVLQLRMAPEYQLCFTHSVIGFAEYQEEGLTAGARRLRMQNPLGMMEYARLQAVQAQTLASRLKNASMFYAYRRLAVSKNRSFPDRDLTLLGGINVAARVAGVMLATYWSRKYERASIISRLSRAAAWSSGR